MKKNSIIVGLLIVAIIAVLGLKNRKTEAPPEEPVSEKALPTLLELGSEHCVPCKMMMPVLDILRQKYPSQLRVEFVDVWKNEEIGKKYNVRSIPTQIFFDANGKELFRHIGFYPRENVEAKWKELGVELQAEPQTK